MKKQTNKIDWVAILTRVGIALATALIVYYAARVL